MFKKIIAAALAALTLTTVGGTVLAASYSGPVNVSNNPNYYYHTCKVDGCGHYADLKYLSLNAEGNWGYVYSRDEGHKDSYKYISITTYGYKEKETSHYVKKIVNNSGIKSEIISPNAFIDGTVSKVVYNGQVFRTSEKQSGILQKYLIGSFRSGTPIK